MATHDDNLIPGKAALYMANCPHIDFWGVNTYQTLNFDSVFYKTSEGPGYSGLTGAARKPVILTEYGLPATGHRRPNDPSSIYEDETTRANTAKVIGPMLLKAIQQGLCLGLYYFEYCDEWWNQPGQPNKYTWWGAFRHGYPHVDKYVAAVTDPEEAARQFWPMFRSTALPYNLFVLQRLTAAASRGLVKFPQKVDGPKQVSARRRCAELKSIKKVCLRHSRMFADLGPPTFGRSPLPLPLRMLQ